MSKEGFQAIENSILKRDVLSAVNDIFTLFNELITSQRGVSESHENNEYLFAAKVSNFNSYVLFARLCEALSAYLLLSNANVISVQNISILVT